MGNRADLEFMILVFIKFKGEEQQAILAEELSVLLLLPQEQQAQGTVEAVAEVSPLLLPQHRREGLVLAVL
jgi:hypothetical protein